MKLKGHWPYTALTIIVEVCKTLRLLCVSFLLFKRLNLQVSSHHRAIVYLFTVNSINTWNQQRLSCPIDPAANNVKTLNSFFGNVDNKSAVCLLLIIQLSLHAKEIIEQCNSLQYTGLCWYRLGAKVAWRLEKQLVTGRYSNLILKPAGKVWMRAVRRTLAS